MSDNDLDRRDELASFQHWNDPGLAERGPARWSELRQYAPRVFAPQAPHPGKAKSWWYVLSYEDAKNALADPATFSSADQQACPDVSVLGIPGSLDPPEHAKYRKLLNPKFSPVAIKQWEGRIRSYCRSLVEKIAPTGECDFHHEFALRFPTAIFAMMMGLPLENLPYYQDLVHKASKTTFEEDPDGSRVAAIEKQISDVFAELLRMRAKQPEDDLMSFLLTLEVDGRRISEESLLSICYVLLRGGLDTVTLQLEHNFKHLANDPALRRLIREESGVIPKVVEELMRYYGMVVFPRTVRHDTEFAGCPMKNGDRLLISTGAANRDPRSFSRPEEFDYNRPPNQAHLGFGSGIHICLGRNLARTELRIALEEWHHLIPDYRVKEGTGRRHSHSESLLTLVDLGLEWH